MSKDLKPKQKLGQSKNTAKKRAAVSALAIALCAGGGYAAYRYSGMGTTEVDVAVAREAVEAVAWVAAAAATSRWY